MTRLLGIGLAAPRMKPSRASPVWLPSPATPAPTVANDSSGKPPKVASTAIMRKLLILGNALVRDARTWTPTLA